MNRSMTLLMCALISVGASLAGCAADTGEEGDASATGSAVHAGASWPMKNGAFVAQSALIEPGGEVTFKHAHGSDKVYVITVRASGVRPGDLTANGQSLTTPHGSTQLRLSAGGELRLALASTSSSDLQISVQVFTPAPVDENADNVFRDGSSRHFAQAGSACTHHQYVEFPVSLVPQYWGVVRATEGRSFGSIDFGTSCADSCNDYSIADDGTVYASDRPECGLFKMRTQSE